MASVKNPDRVKFWNSLVDLARAHALDLSRGGGSINGGRRLRGGTLTSEKQAALAVLAFATLAIEARANHLIDELAEKGRIGPDEASAAQRLPPEHKWFLLRKLAGRRDVLRGDVPPHQAIIEICAQRNALMHFNFGRLRPPAPGKMLSLFKHFVEAMEEMNVVLGRVRRSRTYIKDLGDVP